MSDAFDLLDICIMFTHLHKLCCILCNTTFLVHSTIYDIFLAPAWQCRARLHRMQVIYDMILYVLRSKDLFFAEAKPSFTRDHAL